MAAPTKPWERAEQNNRACCQNGGDTGIGSFQGADRGPMAPTNINRNTVPSIPTRDGFNQTGSLYGTGTTFNRFGSSYGGYGGYNNSYGSYGYSSPYTSGYGSSMYSPYGGYAGGYGGGVYSGGGYGNRFGGGPEGYSRFLQQAEENSRPAFQSIESIVQAFASVSMMLESTFATVHNCFRAVLGVADHFSRLKVNMARILSALAVFRFLRYLYHRLLELLRLRQAGYAEGLWKEAAADAIATPGGAHGPGASHYPSWPIFMFFAVVVGGPYVIWRLLCSEDDTQGVPEWASGEEDHVVARAEYDFDSERPDEVSFKAGDLINLAPKEMQPNIRGWLLASVDGSKVGLVPGNYIKVQGRRKGRKYTTPPGAERQIVPSASTTGFQPPVMESMGSQVSEEDLKTSWGGCAGEKQCGQDPDCRLDQVYEEEEKTTKT